ncbi:transposase family protein [Moritella marina ATCC 15381]|uniref:Transposase family protein n=1 Tax=Moritella marina ATCC 15381 TaxID=1202962 RepID=A0A5J6WPE4_MORMI|nr:DDE-type integrase/transposase/recombinase [Moritella marina]QFI38800.1 transposase family protein [Moritella marina ATCC 15381]
MDEVFLQLNDLLVPIKGEDNGFIDAPHVIIFIDATTDRVFAMDMQKDKKPTQFSYQMLLEALGEGYVIKGILDCPEYMAMPERFIKPNQLKVRDQKFDVIKPIIKNIELFLVSRRYGSHAVEICLEVASNVGINAKRPQIYKWLYRYLRAGCNVNAFLRKPGSGQGENKNYANKTGPKRGSGAVGRMKDSKDEKNIRYIVNKHIKCNAPKSYPKAFVEYEDRFASDPVVDGITGEISSFKRFNEELRISYEQFKNYARAYVKGHVDVIRTAQGETDKFNKDHKGLKGNIEEFYAEGPGHVYQVDETPLNVELVDEFDKTRTIRMGKPTCYSVIDMFSRTWVALLLTFAKASAHTAREVILVAFRDKNKFCEEIGVKLTEPWDISGKCRMIFVDNAEFKAELERSLSKDAQIEQIYNTEGNSQQKGLVERRHKSLEDFLYGVVPGAGKKNIAEYIQRRLRKNALLNIRELYQVLIDFITRYNNYYPIEGLPLSKEMRLDGVDPIPMDKFKWGLKNRPGYLKPVDENELYQSLLEVGEVTIHRDHLFLKGRYLGRREVRQSTKGLKYTCEWTLDKGLQDRESRKHLSKLPCRFMRYSLSTIYIETPEGFYPAILQSSDMMYQNMSDEAIQYDKNKQSVVHEKLKEKHDEKQSETRITASNLIISAKHEQVPINVNQANTQDISTHREEAIQREIVASKKQFNQMLGVEDNQVENLSPVPAEKQHPENTISTIFAAKSAEKRRQRRKS